MLPDDKIVARSARIARQYLHTSLTPDDLIQEGWLAILEAQRDGRVPDDLAHRERYVSVLTLGAMIDACRAARVRWPVGMVELDDGHDEAGHDSTERTVQVRQAVQRFEAKATPSMLAVVRKLAEGLTTVEAARALGVSHSAAWQALAKARALLARWV